ncbi:MAG: hypothetical protein R2822_26260 [Spirosomataceae bacterium]
MVVVILGILFLVLFLGYVRVQPALDTAQLGQLFEVYLEEIDYIWKAHQLYLGSPLSDYAPIVYRQSYFYSRGFFVRPYTYCWQGIS